MKDQRVINCVHEVTESLKNQGRVLLRPSGTEPVLRLMVEAFDENLVMNSLDTLQQVIQDVDKQLAG